MASTGINNGTLTALYVQVAGTPTKVAHLTNTEFSFEMATRDASTKDSGGWQDILEGQKSWSVSAECFFAEDATYGYDELFDAMNSREKVLILVSSQVNGDNKYKGQGYVTSLSRSAGVEESETYSISITGTGAINEYVVS